MPRSVASDLGMHCLPMPHKTDARLIWVILYQVVQQRNIQFEFVSVNALCPSQHFFSVMSGRYLD